MVISSLRGEQAPVDRPRDLDVQQPVAAAHAAESAFTRAMRGLGREIDVGEAQVAAASRLHSYDTQTLIALQAGIYRYTEAVDLASKIVDRINNAVHTVLSGSH
ncbi:MAG TPA: hypothetical protein VNW92_31180 [Polyangiaceae bacterium]|nr:hypothetical protein [Polyangiaceae bacterium]